MELFQEGQVIRDTYEVERVLGEGAFGVVYRVRHKFLGLQSMKVFKATGMTPAEIQGMMEEARLLSQLNHPNIVRVFDAGAAQTPSGVFGFFTMEYVAGGSLDSYWQSHGRTFVPVETAVDIGRQICRGLCVAHGQNPPIVHRDIKPQNILVGYDAEGLRVRVSDFGLAKRANPMTLRLSAKGTPWFKAPEVFLNMAKDMDSCAGDIWAVGSTLYLLLTDRLPYDRRKGAQCGDPYVVERFREDFVPASTYNCEVNPALDRLLTRSLAMDPKDRFPSCRELLVELEAWRPGGFASPPADKSSRADVKKDALGVHSTADEEEARGLAGRAVELARGPGRLSEAADLLEQAINAWPPLHEEFGYRMKIWRRGMMM